MPDIDLVEMANGVKCKNKFYPYKHVVITPSLGGSLATPNINCRFFVKSFTATLRCVAGDTTTLINLLSKSNLVGVAFCRISVPPGTAISQNFTSNVRILLDKGESINGLADATPTYCKVDVLVAEVDDT